MNLSGIDNKIKCLFCPYWHLHTYQMHKRTLQIFNLFTQLLCFLPMFCTTRMPFEFESSSLQNFAMMIGTNRTEGRKFATF
jgi:hypothetical protein